MDVRWIAVSNLAELMLEEELIALFPAVYRANAMAKELKRDVNFEIVLVSPEARGLDDGMTEVFSIMSILSLHLILEPFTLNHFLDLNLASSMFTILPYLLFRHIKCIDPAHFY